MFSVIYGAVLILMGVALLWQTAHAIRNDVLAVYEKIAVVTTGFLTVVCGFLYILSIG